MESFCFGKLCERPSFNNFAGFIFNSVLKTRTWIKSSMFNIHDARVTLNGVNFETQAQERSESPSKQTFEGVKLLQ